jgi:hypothetical protein
MVEHSIARSVFLLVAIVSVDPSVVLQHPSKEIRPEQACEAD